MIVAVKVTFVPDVILVEGLTVMLTLDVMFSKTIGLSYAPTSLIPSEIALPKMSVVGALVFVPVLLAELPQPSFKPSSAVNQMPSAPIGLAALLKNGLVERLPVPV